MKQIIFTAEIFIILFFFGCEENLIHPDITPPLSPVGLSTMAGDNFNEIYWNKNTETDLAGYNVYVGTSITGKYILLGSTKVNHFVDDGIRNGVTYYYRVAAYDFNGNESSLSRDYAYATARPEGYDVTLKDYRNYPMDAGYDFSTYSVGKYDDKYTDIFFEYYNGIYYLDVWDDTEIQDFGYTNSLYDIVEAPTAGWSPTKDVQLIVGHTYIVRTWDYHYAKVRINSLSSTKVIFDWAYQLQSDNTQLKIIVPTERKPLIRSSVNR